MAFSFPLKTTAVLAFLSATSLVSAAPYVDWMNDYTGNEANTITLWKFNADPGYTQNSYDGAANPVAYPTPSINVDLVTTGVPGKFDEGFAIQEDLSSSRAYTNNSQPDSPFGPGSALSVEVWYKTPDTVDTAGYLFDKMYSSSAGIQLLFTGGNLSLRVGNGTAISSISKTAPTLSSNTWYHFAATYNNVGTHGEMKIYLNGVLFESGNTAAGFGDLADGTWGWAIGNRRASGYSPLFGTYDNFRISDVAYEYSNLIPEPGIALLGALGLGTLFTRRRS